MEFLKVIASLVVGLHLLVNSVSGSEIDCEATKSNGSCASVENICIREHDGELEQCFGESTSGAFTSNCPLYDRLPIGDCHNSNSMNYTNVVPSSVSADAYVVSPCKYELRVSWTPSDGAADDPHLQGYQVKLYSVRNGEVSRTPFAGYGCICKNRNETEHSFILPYDREDNKQLRIIVTSYPVYSNYDDPYSKEYTGNFDVPKSCYDSRYFPYDPIHCGPPRYNEPSDIEMESTLTSNDTIVTMSTRISWKPPTFSEITYPNHLDYPIPTTYYLYLRRWREDEWEPGHIARFVTSNTETVTIHSLNITDYTYYSINIHAYVNFSGYSNGDYGTFGCGLALEIDEVIPYPVVQPTSVIISTSTASISTLGIPNSPTSLIVFRSTTSISMPIPSTSSNTTSISMPNVPSTSNPPSTGDGSSRWDNKVSTIVICTMVGLLVATGIIVTIVMIHRRFHINGSWSVTSSKSDVSTDDSKLAPALIHRVWEDNGPSLMTVQKLPSPEIVVIPATGLKVSNTTHTVFLLYSPNSPKEEQNVILQRLYLPLCNYTRVTKPGDYTRTEGSQALWLSKSLSEASAVLCVCNKSFRDEWDGRESASVEVSILRERVAGALNHDHCLSKFAVVYLRQSGRSDHIPELLSGLRHFLMTDIETMVGFITETPRYVPPS